MPAQRSIMMAVPESSRRHNHGAWMVPSGGVANMVLIAGFSMVTTGVTVFAAIRLPLLLGMAAALCLAACASQGSAPSGNISLRQLLGEVGSSRDGALSRVRELLPQEGTWTPGLRLYKSVPFTSSDGYDVGEVRIYLNAEGEVRHFSFYVLKGGCMPLEATPGFDRAESNRLPPSGNFSPPVYPFVKDVSQEWVITLPDARVSLIPKSNDSECIARVGVTRQAP